MEYFETCRLSMESCRRSSQPNGVCQVWSPDWIHFLFNVGIDDSMRPIQSIIKDSTDIKLYVMMLKAPLPHATCSRPHAMLQMHASQAEVRSSKGNLPPSANLHSRVADNSPSSFTLVSRMKLQWRLSCPSTLAALILTDLCFCLARP